MKSIKNLLFTLTLALTFVTQAQEYPFKVDIIGEGHPILFFPGFTCTGDVWENTVKELSDNYQCHIFTFAGFGNVPPIETPWLPKIKNGIIQYISDNELKTPTLVGHSLGGALALWLATESNAYKQLVVVDALPSTRALMMPNFNSDYIKYDTPYNKQILAMDDSDFGTMATQMSSGMTLKEEKRKLIKDWIILADRETYVYGYTDLLKLDLRKDVANINVPVTILAATRPYGKEMAKTTYDTQFKNLKGYQLLFADDSAHFIMYDRPEWFIKNLKASITN